MELDWCSEVNSSTFENFNENSIINKDKKKNNKILDNTENSLNNLNLNDCFSLKLNIDNFENKNVLKIMNYLSFVSNHLRTEMRNKSNKYREVKEIKSEEFDLIIKYLEWIKLALYDIKKFFAIPIRRDNSYDPSNIKLFKTSSYKFCNYKESCSIHKSKQSKCEKNHFVFDMIINDISKLQNSMKIIGYSNINWLLNNNLIICTYDLDTKQYNIENIENINKFNNNEINEYQFIIDKNLVFKSFDVVSYVLNKMYEESLYFLSNNIQSLLINHNN